MKFSKFDVLAACNLLSEWVTLEVRIPGGQTYHVDFVPNGDEIVRSTSGTEHIIPDPQLHLSFPEITNAALLPHEKFGGVKHFYFGKFKTDLGKFRLTLEVEYLDTTEGDVTKHIHPDHVREVYLNLEEPYDGRVCSFYQEHETFCKHTLAIKVALER